MRLFQIALLFILCSIGCFAQPNPVELRIALEEIQAEIHDYNRTFEELVEISNQLTTSKVSDDELEKSWSNDVWDVKKHIESVNELINKQSEELEDVTSDMEKRHPYLPSYGKTMLVYYSSQLATLSNIKEEFNSVTDKEINSIRQRYGKEKMDNPVPIENRMEYTFSDEITSMAKTGVSEKTQFGYESMINSDFNMEAKFMKKNKLDTLISVVSPENKSLLMGRSYKKKKYGLYTTKWEKHSSETTRLLKPIYDSIQTDALLRDYGSILSWSTVLAWKDGKTTILVKESNEKLSTFELSTPFVKLPKIKNGNLKGKIALQTNTGKWIIKNLIRDSVLTVEYANYFALPTVSKEGIIETESKPNDKRIIIENQKDSDTSIFKGFNKNGTLFIKGKQIGEGLVGRCEFFYQGGKTSRVLFFSDTIWLDSTFYRNGTIKFVGFLRPLRPNAAVKINYDDVLYNAFYIENDYKQDALYKEYYASGQLKCKGSYQNGEKVGDWEYYNPLGESVEDETYERITTTELIIPYRLTLNDNQLKGIENNSSNRAIIWDPNYIPVVYELWDTKKKRQFKSNWNLPIWPPINFINDTIIEGNSTEWDGPEWIDIKNNNKVSFSERNRIEPLLKEKEEPVSKKIEFPQERFSMNRKMNMEKTILKGNMLCIQDDSLNYCIDLSLGSMQKSPSKSTEANYVLNSVSEPMEENEALFYVIEMDGLKRKVTNVEDKEIQLNLIQNDSINKKRIVLYDFYEQSKIVFENKNKEEPIKRFVKFEINNQGDYIFFTPDQYYMGSGSLKDLVFFKRGNEYFDFEQFDLKYNRPDIILDRLGYADSSLIAAYHAAYKKRLKKMGFTEDMLKDDFHLPEIEIENFEEMPTLHDQGSIKLDLKLKDSKYKLDRINVWVNDVAIYGKDGISLRDKNVQEYQTDLEVFLAKGKNKVQVSVLNQAGAESYKETFEVECTAGKNQADLYLITIGESEFQQSDFNLTYAAKDAEDMAAIFKESKVYKEVHTKSLINEQVTKENILGLKSFLEKAGINDHVMVFIAGHGVLDANLDYYFATYDMDFQHPEERGIAYEDLESLLDGIKPLKKTLLIDACHSGEIDKEEVELAEVDVEEHGDIQFRVVGKTASPKLGSQNTYELTKSLFTDLRKGTGATVISSAGGMEFAMEGDDWNNGLFTYCLLNGIQSKDADLNGDKEIWLSELKEYVSQQVAILSNGKQQPTSRIENQTVDFRVW